MFGKVPWSIYGSKAWTTTNICTEALYLPTSGKLAKIPCLPRVPGFTFKVRMPVKVVVVKVKVMQTCSHPVFIHKYFDRTHTTHANHLVFIHKYFNRTHTTHASQWVIWQSMTPTSLCYRPVSVSHITTQWQCSDKTCNNSDLSPLQDIFLLPCNTADGVGDDDDDGDGCSKHPMLIPLQLTILSHRHHTQVILSPQVASIIMVARSRAEHGQHYIQRCFSFSHRTFSDVLKPTSWNFPTRHGLVQNRTFPIQISSKCP